MANLFKKIGKGLKKLGKGVSKVVGKIAPVAAFIPGIGTAVAGAAGGLSSLFGKAGKYAQGYADKLGKVHGMLQTGTKGAPPPTDSSLAQYETPREQPAQQTAAASGISPQTLLLGGAALVALVLLTRRK